MNALPPPLAFVVLVLAGWINRTQQAVIEYLTVTIGRTRVSANELIAPQTAVTERVR